MHHKSAIAFALLVTTFWGIARARDEQGPDDCPDGTVWWQRAVDLGFCATVCDSEQDCEADERCRALNDTRPHSMPLVAPTEADIEEAELAEAPSEIPPVVVEEVDCGDCEEQVSTQSESFRHPSTQLCDPFIEHQGAIVSEVEAGLGTDESVPDQWSSSF